MILTAAKLALTSYDGAQAMINVAKDLGYSFHSKSTHPIHQWSAFESMERFLVIHNGSDQWKDWLFDLMAASVPYPVLPKGHAHSGFITAWREIAGSIPYSSKPVSVIGHSKGGAIAQIHAMSRRVEMVYSFNSPRVFDSYAARAYDTKTALYEVRGDITPYLPLGYSRVQKPFVLPSDAPMIKRHSMGAMYNALVRAN